MKILSQKFGLKEKSLNPQLLGLTSGFYELDSLTQGFQKSDLIILAGRPAMGKTAFVLNITQAVLKTSRSPIIFFSLEMSKEQLIYRLLFLISFVTARYDFAFQNIHHLHRECRTLLQ